MNKRYQIMNEALAKLNSERIVGDHKAQTIRKRGKTRRDHESGAWARRLVNQARRVGS